LRDGARGRASDRGYIGHRARRQSRLHCDARRMYHLFRIGMTAESIRLKENSCEIAANRTYIRYPSLPMSKQQLSTELQPREEPDAAEIIKLHNIAVFFGNQTLMIAVKCGELLAKKKDSLSQGQWLPWVKRNLPFTDRTARRYIKVWHNRQTFKEEGRRKTQAHLTTILFCNNGFKVCSSWLTPSRQATNDS